MQHPKTSELRHDSLEKNRGGTTGSIRKPKALGANRDNASSRSLANRSPRAVDHQPQHAPTSEKKRVPELEIQLARLQEELKRSKDQLSETESCMKLAQREAEEAKKQLAAMSAKLESSQKQLDEFWSCEESRIQELRKISHDRDRAWESELKAVQKHHSMDSAALAAALNENQKLRIRLQKLTESESAQAKHADSAHEEAQTLRLQLSETLDLVEELKNKLKDSNDSESRALEELEAVKSRIENDESEESRRAAELESALAANAEIENELRKLKVQTEQWRKAAEVAAAMVLGDGGDRKLVETFEFNVIGEKSNSPYSEDTEDESSIKKTSNMLKKIGVLLKKGQK